MAECTLFTTPTLSHNTHSNNYRLTFFIKAKVVSEAHIIEQINPTRVHAIY